MSYCQKCAINVASNGFEVSKISSQSPRANSNGKKTSLFHKSTLEPFNFPEYSSTKGYQDLK